MEHRGGCFTRCLRASGAGPRRDPLGEPDPAEFRADCVALGRHPVTPYDYWLLRHQWLGNETFGLKCYVERFVQVLDEIQREIDHQSDPRLAAAWEHVACIVRRRAGDLPP